MNLADLVRAAWLIVAVHGLLGLVFAVLLFWRGLGSIDPGTRGAGWMFRCLILPGTVVLWPVLAWRWRQSHRGLAVLGDPELPVSARQLRHTHSLAWKLLAVVVPILLAVALVWRPRPATPSVLPVAVSAGPDVPMP